MTSYTPNPIGGVTVAAKTKQAFRELNGYPIESVRARVRIGDAAIKVGPTCVIIGSSGRNEAATCIDSAVEIVTFYAQAAGLKVQLRPTGEVWYETDDNFGIVWAYQVHRVRYTDDWLPEVAEWMAESVDGGIQV